MIADRRVGWPECEHRIADPRLRRAYAELEHGRTVTALAARLAAAGLLVAVVAKLFLVDLAATGTIARIVSFLIVGGLLILVGYLSPLPPKREGAESTATGEVEE